MVRKGWNFKVYEAPERRTHQFFIYRVNDDGTYEDAVKCENGSIILERKDTGDLMKPLFEISGKSGPGDLIDAIKHEVSGHGDGSQAEVRRLGDHLEDMRRLVFKGEYKKT